MKFVCLTGLLLLVGFGLIGCGNSSSSASSGTGFLYVAAQGDKKISAWQIDLGSGALTSLNNKTDTGDMPMAAVTTGSALFVANNIAQPSPGSISSYTVNTDGTLAAGSTTTETGSTSPAGMVLDPAGKFLFVANQGTFVLNQSGSVPGSISVFSINGTTLTEVAGSPFSTEPVNPANGSGPVALAISPDGKYLYVANQFDNNVSVFTVAGDGTLTPTVTYAVGTTPTALALTPDGNFLFVANGGSNNISAFATCTNTTLTCPTPDGHLTSVAGSPFSAGLDPVAIAISSTSLGEYMYVADYNSNQVSQYKVAPQTGLLTPLGTPTISTGANPISVVVRAGTGSLLGTGGTNYYVYTSNTTAGTISSFVFDSTDGLLNTLGTGPALMVANQPAALAVK